MTRIYVALGLALTLVGEPQPNFRLGFAEVSNAVLLQFDKHDLVALGEWHNTREDQDLRINLIRNPQFPKKVRNIVVECGNARHQETLDRFIAGLNVPKEEIQRVWRDTTQSPVGGGDSPMCEEFLNEVRAINLKLPKTRRLRVLAGDPPIDWAKINSAEFQQLLRGRDEFAAQLVAREILGKKSKAVLIYGAGHVWRNSALNRTPNLATLLDRSNPGSLFTVVRLGGTYPNTPRLESLMPNSRPAFLALKGTPAAVVLDANEFLGRGLPVKLFAAGLGMGEVADACVYSGQRPDTPITPYSPDPAYDKEKARRREFMPRPRR